MMRLLFAFLTYVALTSVLFGDPVLPIQLAMQWSDRFGPPHWPLVAASGIAASALVFVKPVSNAVPKVLGPATFVALAVLLPTGLVGLYADWGRHHAVRAFGADEVIEHSFFASISEAPREFQFFLHTAALKGCTPYAWSYRTMSFYVVPPNARTNVLPQSWINRCGLHDARAVFDGLDDALAQR